ncbi:MAG: hypothetical protein IJX81_05435 [Clostridia bacterium]|nr:hypothetical protein [Clostridia bacterium]
MTEYIVSMGQGCVEHCFLVALAAVLTGVAIGFFARSTSVYSGWVAALLGGFFLFAFLSGELLEEGLFLCLFLALSLWGGGVLLLTGALAVRRRARFLKKRREEKKRRVEFMLPDDKNGYLRLRLDTALKPREEEKSETGVRLEYVQGLLAKLKAAPLAALERLQTEELSKQIALYCARERLTAEEQRALGDCFSQLLKTAAKYGV